MSNGRQSGRQRIYQIKVEGNLDPKWSDWFDGLAVTPQTGVNETLLSGPITDQAALHSILARIRDLGLPLLSVQRMESGR